MNEMSEWMDGCMNGWIVGCVFLSPSVSLSLLLFIQSGWRMLDSKSSFFF
jgi:hypothetical protein